MQRAHSPPLSGLRGGGVGLIKLLSRCGFFRGRFGGRSFRGRFCSGLRGGFSQNLDLHMSGDFAMQLDGHVEIAQALQRLVQLNLAAVNREAFDSSSAAISDEVTEPNKWPASPDLRVKLSTMGASLVTCSSA